MCSGILGNTGREELSTPVQQGVNIRKVITGLTCLLSPNFLLGF